MTAPKENSIPSFSDEELEIIINSCNNWIDTLGHKFRREQTNIRHNIAAKIRNYLWDRKNS